MANKVSSNYLLNKYSLFLFFLFSFCFYKLIITQYDLKTFFIFEIPITIAYIVWIITNGSYHFISQTRVYKHDKNTLCLKKMNRTLIITDNDVDMIYFYPIVFMKGIKTIVKIKLRIYTKEEFFFQIKFDKGIIDPIKLYDIGYFYKITNNFWETVSKSKIKLANSIFSV